MPDYETLTKWVKAIKGFGAEPLMQVSQHKSPEESAKLVAFFNKDEATKIKFWSIGNEPYHMAKMTVDSISAFIKAHATAMKAADPSIKIHVPDLAAYFNEAYEPLLLDDKLSISGRDENGNWYVDGINFHNYPNAKDYNRSDVIFYSVTKMRGMILDLKEDMEAANKKYERLGDDALVWGLTEFNITYDNPDDLSVTGIAVPSFINGQFWVDVYCMAMEYNAFTVTPWCIQESDRPSTYFGYIGGPPNFTPHATYYHMQMLADNMKGNYIKMLSSNPYLKVFGSQFNDETTIVIMNQHETKTFNIDLSAINNKTGELIITSAQPISANYKGISKPNSTLLLKFNKKGLKIEEILYDLDMAVNNQPPKKI
jgi:alpha-L-arabinofuranosidase